MVEIQITKLQFQGVESRLILIRNVNYVLEQQQLKTRAEYDRRLTDTLSHELLTPLNCIINMSEPLMLDAEDELKPFIQKYGEDLKEIEPKDRAIVVKLKE